MTEEKRVVLAVGAHPDDVEILMAGTLILLTRAGFEPHIFTVANGSCGASRLDPQEVSRIRRAECERAAEVIGATYHPALVDDVMIYYEDRLLRRVTAVVREVRPTIVLLHSLEDYLEDHTMSARLVATACFSRGSNYISAPPRPPTSQDVYLYHAQPFRNRDGMRNLIVPSLFVDIGEVMETKLKMLACHQSQRNWLKESQGADDYLDIMRHMCSEVARMSGLAEITYAEGFRQHNHVGYSSQDKDLLREVLGDKVKRRKSSTPPRPIVR